MRKELFTIINEATKSDNNEAMVSVAECEIQNLFDGVEKISDDVDTKLTVNSVRIFTDAKGNFFIDLQELLTLSTDMGVDLITCLNEIIKEYETTGIGADNFKVIIDSPESYEFMAKAIATDSKINTAFAPVKAAIFTLKSNNVGLIHK